MLLNLDEEQSLIDSSVVDMLKNEYSFQQRRYSLESASGVNEAIWKQFADLGWLGMSLNAKAGGLELGLLESGLLMAGLGRHLVIEPVWSSAMLAAHALQRCAPSRIDLLESLVNGDERAALVYQGVTSLVNDGPSFLAKKTSTGYELSGKLNICPGAPSAEHLLVLAALDPDQGKHSALFLVHRNTPGVVLQDFQMLDGSRASTISINRANLSLQCMLSDRQDTQSVLDVTIAQSMLLLSWEAMGSMTAAFEQTCSYVSTRKQFDRPLREFQVVQHRLAEMAVLCREARAICELGVTQVNSRPTDTIEIAMHVKAKVSRCAQTVSKECVQLHGAMGVTEDLAIASHFRKLLWFQTLWGQAEELDERTGALRLKSGDAFQSAILSNLPALAPIKH